MINPFILLYFVILLFFVFGAFAIVFHLLIYKMNRRFAFLVTLIFSIGAAVLFLTSVSIALMIDWSKLNIILF